MKRFTTTSQAVAMTLMFATSTFADTFGGVEFAGGNSSFADRVISYEPSFGGGPAPAEGHWLEPNQALGIPDYNENKEDCCYVSLGKGGRLTLQFVDNALTGSNDSTSDLYIFEIGPDVEDTFVEISKDGQNFVNVGKVYGGTSTIDIDAFGFTSSDQFYYVRLTDDPNEGSSSGETVGADIDAVGAIASIKVSSPVNEENNVCSVYQAPINHCNGEKCGEIWSPPPEPQDSQGEIPIDRFRSDTGNLWENPVRFQPLGVFSDSLGVPYDATHFRSGAFQNAIEGFFQIRYACEASWYSGAKNLSWIPINVAGAIEYCVYPDNIPEVVNHLRAVANKLACESGMEECE